jgi:integrase
VAGREPRTPGVDGAARNNNNNNNDADRPRAASRQALEAIDLTFHHLRHESGSRLLEAGWPLHNLSHLLGHASIAQTSTYLNATRVGLQDAMPSLQSGCKHGRNDRPPVRNEGEARDRNRC